MSAYHNGQLRSYIAPAAPATRAPCDGSEPDLRVEYGFTPRWFHVSCGIDFGEQWHTDPIYRWQSQIAMRKELNRRFPPLQLGGPNPEAALPSLDGAYGALVVPMVFGMHPVYYKDNWPAIDPVPLSDDEADRLEPPSIESSPAIARLMGQMDAMEREAGRIEGYINWQGVLNVAYRLRGQAIYTDMLVAPERARHIFRIVMNTMIAGMRLVYGRQAQTGVHVRHATVSNCLVNMVSPELYREFLLPCDRTISESFEFFGIHNCAWNVNPYIADYSSVAKLGYVDMGIESDYVTAKRLCPQARRAVMYKPTDLANKSLEQIRADLARIYLVLSPCDIVLADIEAGTPDRRVVEFSEVVADLLSEPAGCG